MSKAKSNKMGVVQLTILTMVNMMGSGIIMLPTKLAEGRHHLDHLVAGDCRWFNGAGMGFRQMRDVQP
ncbi:putrescine transporter [Citrobacter koseri]|nr:putrescine transporter [Citrobacter koseri]